MLLSTIGPEDESGETQPIRKQQADEPHSQRQRMDIPPSANGKGESQRGRAEHYCKRREDPCHPDHKLPFARRPGVLDTDPGTQPATQKAKDRPEKRTRETYGRRGFGGSLRNGGEGMLRRAISGFAGPRLVLGHLPDGRRRRKYRGKNEPKKNRYPFRVHNGIESESESSDKKSAKRVDG